MFCIIAESKTARRIGNISYSSLSSHSKTHHITTSESIQTISNTPSSAATFNQTAAVTSRGRRSIKFSHSPKRADRRDKTRSVETIVVIDSAMIDSHGQKNVSIYALTLLNMVRSAALSVCSIRISTRKRSDCVHDVYALQFADERLVSRQQHRAPAELHHTGSRLAGG